MKNLLAVLSLVFFAACGGGGDSAPAASAPQNANTPPVVPVSPSTPSNPPASSADLALAARLYKGDERTPAGFDVEARPANVTGTLSTRHLRNTDFATGPQAAGPTYEVCTDDLAQALAWSEQLAAWNGQYSDLAEVRTDAQKFELVRVPRADASAMLRHRVFKCGYVDRAGSDLRSDSGAAGSMNQRPLTAAELEALTEYLWQFTMFNNSDFAVESSSGTTQGDVRVHVIRMGQLVRGSNGACDLVTVVDWTHRMNLASGALTRSLTEVRAYAVRETGGVATSCAG